MNKSKKTAKRSYLSFRVTSDMHRKIVEEAKKNGRSIAEEVEYRLEKTVWEDQLLGRWAE